MQSLSCGIFPARQRQSYAPRRLHHGAERYRSITGLFAVLLLVALSVATVTADPTGWQLVGDQGFSANPVFETKLALDTSGTPYVLLRSYHPATNAYEATVMRYNGTAREVVGSPGFTWSMADELSLALDPAGVPYVAYIDLGPNVIRCKGSVWRMVGASNFSTAYANIVSLALDAGGAPYVAYADAAAG